MTSSLCSMNTSISSQTGGQAANLSNTSNLLATFPPAPLSPVKECREPRSPAKIKCHQPDY